MAAALLAITLAACGHLRPVGEPPSWGLYAAMPAEHVRAMILRGLEASAFSVEEESPGVIRARSTNGELMVRVTVHYDASSYAIAYDGSMGMHAEVDDQGRTMIDRSYHRIVQRLGAQIARAIATTPVDTTVAIGGAPPVPPTYGGEAPPLVDPPPTIASGDPVIVQPIAPPIVSPVAPAIVSPLAPPIASAQPASPDAASIELERQQPLRDLVVRREPIYELIGIGAALLGGGWVANWGATLAISGDSEMIGASFVPFFGPFAQLGYLRWDTYGRWTGLFYPLMGVVQIAGVIMAVVGQVVQLPVRDDTASSTGFGRTWAVAPTTFDGQGGGLAVFGAF